MQMKALGDAGIQVSRLGFGCMGLAEFYGDALSESEAARILEAALEGGINFFDTADMYGSGRNEEQLARFLKKHRDDVVLATKFAIQRNADGGLAGLSNDPAYIREACDKSLQRLGIEQIDLYYMHRRDRNVPIEESVGAMADLVQEGKVRALGLSEVSAETLRKANDVHPIAALQSEYSIMTREMEADIFPLCHELDVAFVAYSPLGRGLLTGAYRQAEDFGDKDYRLAMNPRFSDGALQKNLSLVDQLNAIADEKGASLAQIALAWVLAKDDNVIPIPGTKKLDRLQENLGATKVELTADDLAAIERAVPPEEVAGERYPETSASTLNA